MTIYAMDESFKMALYFSVCVQFSLEHAFLCVAIVMSNQVQMIFFFGTVTLKEIYVQFSFFSCYEHLFFSLKFFSSFIHCLQN